MQFSLKPLTRSPVQPAATKSSRPRLAFLRGDLEVHALASDPFLIPEPDRYYTSSSRGYRRRMPEFQRTDPRSSRGRYHPARQRITQRR